MATRVPTPTPTDQAKAGDEGKSGTPQENPADGGTARQAAFRRSNGRHGAGSPGGGGTGDKTSPAGPSEAVETPDRRSKSRLTPSNRPNWPSSISATSWPRKSPSCSIELGWTKDDARRFLEKWEEMKRMAAEQGPQGEAARKNFNDALRSLGLRPRGTELRRGGVTPDKPQNLRDPRSFAAPPEWDEQLRAYTRGVAGADRQQEKK